MKQIVYIGKEGFTERNGHKRWHGQIFGSIQIMRSRLNMMNFLHTKHLPSYFDVHHKDENTENDDISNLELLTRSQHMLKHKHRDYKYGVSKAEVGCVEYEKARLINDPLFKGSEK
jgi:hypothetical protein